MDIQSATWLKFYFDKKYLDQTNLNEIELELTVGIYESNNLKFHKQCQKSNFLPTEKINLKD